MLRRHLPLVGVAGVLLVASVSAIASSDQTGSPSEGVTQVDAIEPEAAASMAVLRQARGQGDALSADLAERMDANSDFGMNPRLSRLSIGNVSSSLYAIPARDHVCAALTVGEGANVTCPSTADVAAGRAGPATVTLATGGIGIYGLVPDGVDSVSVQTGSSDSDRLATDRNAYYTVVRPGTPLSSVRYTGPSGPVEFAIYDPASPQSP